jgi:hypothetical protein
MSFVATLPTRRERIDHAKLRALTRTCEAALEALRGMRSTVAGIAADRQALRSDMLANHRGRYALGHKGIDLDPFTPWTTLASFSEAELKELTFSAEDVARGQELDADLAQMQAQIDAASLRVSQQRRVVQRLAQYAQHGAE